MLIKSQQVGYVDYQIAGVSSGNKAQSLLGIVPILLRHAGFGGDSSTSIDKNNKKEKYNTMDPQVCLEQIRVAYGCNDWDELADACDDLRNWIRKGGFIPSIDEPTLSALVIMAYGYANNRRAYAANINRDGIHEIKC